MRSTSTAEKEKDKELGTRSSPLTLLAFRMMPFYVWFVILTVQPHKEERFFFPAYPFLAFNAAVTLYLVRGWLETAYVGITKSPYQASRTSFFQLFTLAVIVFASAVSISRVLAQGYYFHAPLQLAYELETKELVRVMNVTGLLPPTPPPSPRKNKNDEPPRVDLRPIRALNMTLCLGKEWHRFTSHFLFADGINVEFVKSDFDGMLPRHFVKSEGHNMAWPRDGTRFIPDDLNDMNKEDPSHYVRHLVHHL